MALVINTKFFSILFIKGCIIITGALKIDLRVSRQQLPNCRWVSHAWGMSHPAKILNTPISNNTLPAIDYIN
jgi:hypothetical protein